MPPSDAPLADFYPDLKRRADAGDAHASCRVAFELMRCRTVLTERPLLDAWLVQHEADLDEFGSQEGANRVAEAQIAVADRAKACAALPREDIASGGEYLHRAAVAGIAEAQVRYAQGTMFGLVADRLVRADSHAFLRHPEFDRWRREAPGMARALVEARHAAGLSLMAEAYMHDELPFAALIADDEVDAFAYLQLARLHSGVPRMPDARFGVADRQRIASIERRYPAAQFIDDARERALTNALYAPVTPIAPEDVSGCD